MANRRKPLYLSPSAISLFEKSKEDYYCRYIAPVKPALDPQTQPMALGSALDAYAKAAFIKDLTGADTFEELFISSVEIHNRDFAKSEGKLIFEVYKKYGVYDQLLRDLQNSPVQPRFEFELKGTIAGVPLLGKPDIFYYTADAKPVILDFKVNGYQSKSFISPMSGYTNVLPEAKNHPDCLFASYGEHKKYNMCKPLNRANSDWGRQLAIYAWLCGVNVGDSFLTEIHQFVGNPRLTDSKGNQKPLRIAIHSSMVESTFQTETMNLAQDIWRRVQSGHFFSELPFEESEARCQLLDKTTTIPTEIIDR
jgi:hypothetical protein